MIGNTETSLFARIARKLFYRRLNREIFYRLFPHLRQESDEGYPFAADEEMVAQTEMLDVQRTLAELEAQIEKLPKAYGRCFRYLMHKDIQQQLQMYMQAAKRRTPPERIDPRFVARHA